MRTKAYWVRRTAALEKAMQEDARSAAESIIKAYERSIENINTDIRNIFKTYVVNGIPEKEAVGLLNAAERDKTYQQLLKLYQNTANPQAKAEIMNRINAQAYGARISRLEGVKARIYTRLAEAANYSERTQQTLYTNTLQSSYYTNIYNIAKGINAGIDFTVLPQNAIDRVLNEPWFGGNYSSRIWAHNAEFVDTLQSTLESGILEGNSVNRMAEQMLDFVNEGVNNIRMNTERLVRSETAHFMNQGQLAAYEEIGIEKYQFVAALSERTCDICGNLDSEIFYVAEAIEGENFPPLHAQCRCTTVMAGAVPETRIARNPETGETYKVDGDMNFNEWKNSLADEQRDALKYVDKSAKSDIMKIGSGSDNMNAEALSTRFINSSERLYKNADNIKPIDGFEDIVIHGDKTGFAYHDKNGNEMHYTVREFAEILKDSDVYKGGNIRLISCEAGAEGAMAAQSLANLLNVNVMAPSDIVWVLPDGEMIIGRSPNANTGIWKIFRPKASD